MAGTFTLTITTITSTRSAFGETRSSERNELVYLLEKACRQIGDGADGMIFDQYNNNVGSFIYGAGMINAPGGGGGGNPAYKFNNANDSQYLPWI